MAEEHKTVNQRYEEYQAQQNARPWIIKTADSIYSYLRFRLIDNIYFILAPKHKLEKEHKEIGMTYWDRPRKFDFDLVYQLAWVNYAAILRFRRIKHMGVPSEFVDEEGYLDEAAWMNVLDKIIYAFKELIFDDYVDKLTQSRVDEGLQLYAKYFQNLWD